MNFKPFDNSKLEAYAAEAKAKWGKTQAYREFEEKTKDKSKEKRHADGDKLMEIFAQMGAIRHEDPAGETAQALVKKLQQFITDHYYTCTNQILVGLGQLYIAGDSMTENINAAGGEGTAEFAHRAIEAYCKTEG